MIGIADLDLDQGALDVTKACLPRGVEQHMPLARYFYFVGGALFALMFILDACFPRSPAPERAHANLPAIRIHTDRKWPERIVYDTALPTIVPASIASADAVAPAAENAEPSAGTKGWQSFAMLPPAAERPQVSNTKMQALKPRHHRKIARKHPPSSTIAMARQPQFGWFGRNFW